MADKNVQSMFAPHKKSLREEKHEKLEADSFTQKFDWH
jgi:hypothetical protein